jgi:protoporphyrinogen oxidase
MTDAQCTGVGKQVVVLGAGSMGLAVAHHALKAGHRVTVLEADVQPGGMAAHFDFGGFSLERFYHFMCTSDHATLELMNELGIGDQVTWKETSMGFFVDGQLFKWGDPFALLTFPKMGWISKFRYGLHAFASTKRNDWRTLDKVGAYQWVRPWIGEKAFNLLWKPLFELKFYEHAPNVSAAWIWQRVKRLGNSRKSIFQEVLGHINGGSETLVNALVNSIQVQGGTLELATAADEVLVADNAVTGVRTTDGRIIPADAVISTVPTPYVGRIARALPQATLDAYAAIENIGVVCVVLKLAKSVTPHFWVNISDKAVNVPGFVEFSNLRDADKTIVYVPYYMPASNPLFSRPDDVIVAEAFGHLKRVNPILTDGDLLHSYVGRLKHAQPICTPGFLERLPPVQTSIAGLQIADTCFYYPEDRGISESVRFAKLMAQAI